MLKAKHVDNICLVSILLTAGILVHYCQVKLDASADTRAMKSAEVLPKAEVLKMVSLGYDQILADIYWLNFIQYFGDTNARLVDHYDRCYDYLSLISALDPHFIQAYWFAAFAVGTEQKRPDLAEKIISRGLSNNQDNWYLPYIAGVNEFINSKDDKKAAKYYKMAAKFPGSPPWLSRQAQILDTNLPRIFKEIRTWATVYESNPDGLVKSTARTKLIDLWRFVYRHTPDKHSKEEVIKQLGKLDAKP
jgi:hypothetical protein